MTLVDTNILFDVLTEAPIWADWSQAQLDRAASNGRIVVNDVVYAELSIRYSSSEDVSMALTEMEIELAPTPREALFAAGKAFQRYRQSGGQRTGVLPDFFIGAHAAALGLPLLTRDVRHYRNYFPTVTLIAPDRRA